MAAEGQRGEVVRLRQRAHQILQAEGLLGLAQRAQRRLRRRPAHYGSYVFELRLDRPIAAPPPRLQLEIQELTSADEQELEALVEADPWPDSKSQLLELLRGGHHCYVGKHDGHIVCGGWWKDREYVDEELGRTFRLADHEVLAHSVFTTASFRGQQLFPHFGAALASRLADETGKRRALCRLEVSNRPAQRAWTKMGARCAGRVGFVELFGFRFHYLWGSDAFRSTTDRFFLERV